MEEATKYKKYLKALKEATKKKPKVVKPIKRNLGGASMLKNPGKADLDKDGKLSGYEKKRGMAIEKSMSGKPMKAALGAMALGMGAKKMKDKDMALMPLGMAAMLMKKKKMKEMMGAAKGKSVRGYGAARTSGTGLQDESVKPGKVMNANKGMYLKSEKVKEIFPDKSPSARARIQQMVGGDRTAPMKRERMEAGVKARRKKFFDKLRKVAKTAGSKMPGAISVGEARRIKEMLPKKKMKMGGGMMNKPMGYKKGSSIMARGCKLGRKKATKLS